MIVRRDYRDYYAMRRRPARIRMMLVFTVLAVAASVAVLLNLSTVQDVAAKALGFNAVPTLYPAEYAMMGAEAFQSGNMAEAAKQFEIAVRLQPTNVAYLYEYGRTLIEMTETARASEVADLAIAANPNDVRGYALKANALAYSDPTNSLIYALQGQEIDQNFAPIYSALAIANTMIYRYTAALQAGERAVELAPDDPGTHRAYAVPLLMVGRTEEVIEQLELATSINPNLPGPWFELAAQYKSPRVNNPRRALAIYNFMVNNLTMSIDDTAKAYLRICETYSSADQADFAAAQANCERALAVKPDYGSAYRELGRMQYNRRNYEGAIETFQKCVELGATDIECWALRGLAHYWMNECDLAWQVLNEAQAMSESQDGLMVQVGIGLSNVREHCPDYANVAIPTAIPPTAIPPTPIGGL